jgi:hypothetical protein
MDAILIIKNKNTNEYHTVKIDIKDSHFKIISKL